MTTTLHLFAARSYGNPDVGDLLAALNPDVVVPDVGDDLRLPTRAELLQWQAGAPVGQTLEEGEETAELLAAYFAARP